MLSLVKPPRLRPGDRVATVSLSAGLAGDPAIRWRYEQGKRRLQEDFGLEVVEMPHTLSGSAYVYAHPRERAGDLMQAFSDPSIRGIIACIGGTDSIRMLPYIDFDVIRRNPKIFLGYSDSTVTHCLCLKAGLSSFYGAALLTDFAENVAMPAYTAAAVRRALFSAAPIGEIGPSPTWTAQRLERIEANKDTARVFSANGPYEIVQRGTGVVRGPLIGGCLEVLEYIKGTSLFPPADAFDGAVLFLETSEVLAPPWLVEDELRCLGMMGILGRLAGMFWGKPMGEHHWAEYRAAIRKVLAEFGRGDLPVLGNGSFGHNEPHTVLPLGALAELDCAQGRFSVLDSGVI